MAEQTNPADRSDKHPETLRKEQAERDYAKNNPNTDHDRRGGRDPGTQGFNQGGRQG